MEITPKSSSVSGFTLLEILVAMSVASVVGVLIIQVFFTTTRTNTKTELLKDVKQNGQYAMAIMERMIRNARSVDTVCALSGTTVSSLTITNPDGNTTTFGCILDSGVTRIASQSGSGNTDYITSSNVTLGGATCADANNSLQFVCTSYPAGHWRIDIAYSLAKSGFQVDRIDQASATFQSSVTTRN